MRFNAKVMGLLAVLALSGATDLKLVTAADTPPANAPRVTRLPKVGILPTAPCELFTVEAGAKVFTDGDATLESVSPEIRGLYGVRLPAKDAQVALESRAPVQLLVGYFRGQRPEGAPAATGPVIRNAATVRGQPVDLYLLAYERGKRTLSFPGTSMILGVIPAGVTIPPHDAEQAK